MKQIYNISLKELKDYFISPIAYIVISIFLLITGWFFFSTFFLYNQANLRPFFDLLPFIFSFVIPALTMRLFSEELNIGSYEVLVTMPVNTVDIILGKFIATIIFIAVMLIPTISNPIFISFIGQVDWGPVIGGYIGALFLGGAYVAIGIFASSTTRNQIIAFIIGMAICFIFTIIDRMLFLIPGFLVGIIGYLGADYHFQNIAKGIIDTRDLIYFLSLMFISLYGTYLVLQEKK